MDRYLGMHFFTNDRGGNAMMYVNLIWVWGHPEVYILVLPAFGVFSEVVATFSRKTLFGYTSMVYATLVISVLSFFVWLHHFFTMGSGANVNAFFGITTMIISIPTGREDLQLAVHDVPRPHSLPRRRCCGRIGFMVTFVIGGMTGVLLAIPARRLRAAQQPVPGRALPQRDHRRRAVRLPRGHHLLVPQGVRLHAERAPGARCAFWCWFVGFYVAFMPLYVLGFMGMTRRMNTT